MFQFYRFMHSDAWKSEENCALSSITTSISRENIHRKITNLWCHVIEMTIVRWCKNIYIEKCHSILTFGQSRLIQWFSFIDWFADDEQRQHKSKWPFYDGVKWGTCDVVESMISWFRCVSHKRYFAKAFKLRRREETQMKRVCFVVDLFVPIFFFFFLLNFVANMFDDYFVVIFSLCWRRRWLRQQQQKTKNRNVFSFRVVSTSSLSWIWSFFMYAVDHLLIEGRLTHD